MYAFAERLRGLWHHALVSGATVDTAGSKPSRDRGKDAVIKSKPAPRSPATARRRDRRRVRLITAAGFLVLAVAWLIGYFRAGADILPRVPRVLPEADRVEQKGDVYYGYAAEDELIGYAGVSDAVGYAGPIQMLVGVNLAGEIIGIEVIEHRETPSFFAMLQDEAFLEQFLGRDYTHTLRLGEDLDAVSGATISSEAVARAVREQTRALGNDPIGAQVPPSPEPIQFGAPEILLIALFVVAYFGHRTRNSQAKKWIRRGTLAAGVIGLGFIFNQPLTVAHFISLLSGYWPDWHTNLYWFLLLGGILFVTTAQAKNPYCSWFCPFGAVQEGLGKVSGAKLYRPRKLHTRLQWFQRALVLSAVIVGLVYRQPGAVSYEPFGTLFDFTGSTFLWVLLALVLLTSFLVSRPFCNYLCPMNPIVDFIGENRRWGEGMLRKVRQ